MNKGIKYIIGCVLIIAFNSCNSNVESSDQVVVGDDSTAWSPNALDTLLDDYRFDDVLIVDGTIDIESFQNKFSTYFDHQFDFGWRYITANYDDYPEDSSLECTETNLTFDLQKVTAVSVEGDAYSVVFDGFAHSYQYVNGGHIYVTYIQGEISEELHYYYVNAAFEVLKEGTLASSGGDEGSWSYSYGEFSKDFSVYQIYHANGEGIDTSEFSSDIFYFD